VEVRRERHKYSIAVDFEEQRRRDNDCGWDSDIGGLAELALALVAGVGIPLDILLERGPPETVEESAAVVECVVSVQVSDDSDGEALVVLSMRAVPA